MGLKILPNSISPEKLLELLKEAPDTKEVIEGKNDVVAFLSAFHIEPGPNVIKKALLFDLYRAWSGEPVSRNVFSAETTRFLLLHVKGANSYYLLNQEAFNLSERAFKLLRDKKTDRRKMPHLKRHYENYLAHYNVKPGTYWIEAYYLFYLYDKWAYSLKKTKPLSFINFMGYSKLYFKHQRRTSSRMEWLAVDKDVLKHFKEGEMREIKEGRDKKYEKRQEKTNKTRNR